ncbi:MAG: thiamine ABC transporter ATP-binding protein [Pseudomonadota bacterium]
MIQVEDLRLAVGDFALTADFEVARGEIVALIGPSGAGKSLLLQAIAGFEEPVAGTLSIDGRDMHGVAPAARPVTLLFQEHNLFPHLSVGQNVGLGRRPDLRLRAEDRAAVAAGLAEVGLADFEERRPGDLSGGERQRVALARALLRDRPVVLLDEPFAALGPAQRAEMLDLVQALSERRGTTVLMVTHAPEDARRIANRTVPVAEGRAGPAGETATLLETPPPALATYLGSG